MKRFLLLVTLVISFALPRIALGEGVTLRTVSCFAGEDVAAISYV